MTMNNKDTEAPERIWMRAEVLASPELREHFVKLNADDIEYARVDPPAAPTEDLRTFAAERVANAARQFCEEVQEDAEGVPPVQLANLNEALDAWEAYPDARASFDDSQPILAALASLIEDEHATDHQRRVARLALTAIQGNGGALTEPERDQIRRAIAESDIAGCALENSDIDALVDLFEAWLERRVVTAPPAPDEADQTLERQTRKMAKKEASQADTIILHQASDGHYHWFCRNCKSERLGISRETVLSDYLPNVTCANCGFQFGVDKRYLSSTEPPAVSEPSALALPEWSDCESAVDEKMATPLQEFIYEYEPGNNDKEWRARLTAALAQARKEGAQEDYAYAVRLATWLQRQCYAGVEGWQPLATLNGVLSQIDNMIAGVLKKREKPTRTFRIQEPRGPF